MASVSIWHTSTSSSAFFSGFTQWANLKAQASVLPMFAASSGGMVVAPGRKARSIPARLSISLCHGPIRRWFHMLRRILIAEDDPKDVELSLDALCQHNLANEVTVVRDGVEALEYLHSRGAYAERPPENPV